MNKQDISQFQQTVLNFYIDNGRFDLPWRQPEADGNFDPYKILVSELMLQQTQVARVIPKFNDFVQHFPTIKSLAKAQLSEVLIAWSGLGYNRRAKFLHQSAQFVTKSYNGKMPTTVDELVKLPGVGINTAGAIAAYAFNQPVVFIETNVRTAYIHHFFADKTGIADKDIIELTTQTLDITDARTWYWALMDYGSYLKQSVGNLNRASKTYAKQSKFQGSKRQIRGEVIRQLSIANQSLAQLKATRPDERLSIVLDDLLKEDLIHKKGGIFRI